VLVEEKHLVVGVVDRVGRDERILEAQCCGDRQKPLRSREPVVGDAVDPGLAGGGRRADRIVGVRQLAAKRADVTAVWPRSTEREVETGSVPSRCTSMRASTS